MSADASVITAPSTAAPRDPLAPMDGVEGSWSLTAIDGERLAPIDGRPLGGVHIGRHSAGGSAGCNGGGGPALVVGGRLMMPGVMATQMACGRALLEREDVLFDTLSAMPRLSLGDGGRSLTLTGPSHRLGLVRSYQRLPEETHATTSLLGKTVTVTRVDASRASDWRSGIMIAFSADQLTLAAPGCAPVVGSWRADGDRVTLAISDAAPCATDLGVRTLIASTPDWRWLVDGNREAILASADHMMSGQASPRR